MSSGTKAKPENLISSKSDNNWKITVFTGQKAFFFILFPTLLSSGIKTKPENQISSNLDNIWKITVFTGQK